MEQEMQSVEYFNILEVIEKYQNLNEIRNKTIYGPNNLLDILKVNNIFFILNETGKDYGDSKSIDFCEKNLFYNLCFFDDLKIDEDLFGSGIFLIKIDANIVDLLVDRKFIKKTLVYLPGFSFNLKKGSKIHEIGYIYHHVDNLIGKYEIDFKFKDEYKDYIISNLF